MSEFQDQLKWIESQQDAMRDRVIAWCDINSYTFNLPGLARVGAEVERVVAQLGATCEWIDVPPARSTDSRGEAIDQPLGKALRARKRPDAPRQIFLGIHLDTVYSPDQAFQRVEQIDANTLRGPGVIDAKGGLVVMLAAIEALERSEIAKNVGWEVLLNPDEEIGSPGSANLFVEAALRNHLGLVFEPATSLGNLVHARKGTGGFTFIVHGRAAHAGRDHANGRNAIAALAEIITQLHRLNETMPGIVVNVGKVEGGGATNVVPDLAIARVNVRIEVPEDEARLREAFTCAVDPINQREGFRAEFHGQISSPPKILDPRTAKLLDLILASAKELGLNLSTQAVGGVSDGNKLAAAGLPVIDSLGPRGGKLHSPEEFLYIDSLTERAKLTAVVLIKIASGELALP